MGGGSILAIEPDLFLANLISKSAKRQNYNKKIAEITVLPMAVSNKLGVVKFNIAARGRSTNFLASTVGAMGAGGVRETTSVFSATLDWLLDYYPAPTVLKIDVETAEDLVLRGAKRLLSEIRPVIFCEVSPDNTEKIANVANILKEHNYVLYNAELEPNKRIPLEIPSFNTLAMPTKLSYVSNLKEGVLPSGTMAE